MPSLSLLLFLAVLVLGVLPAQGAADTLSHWNAVRPPVLLVPEHPKAGEAVLDLGIMAAGMRAYFTVRLLAGQEPVMVESVTTSCGCLHVKEPERGAWSQEDILIGAYYEAAPADGLIKSARDEQTLTVKSSRGEFTAKIRALVRHDLITREQGPHAVDLNGEQGVGAFVAKLPAGSRLLRTEYLPAWTERGLSIGYDEIRGEVRVTLKREDARRALSRALRAYPYRESLLIQSFYEAPTQSDGMVGGLIGMRLDVTLAGPLVPNPPSLDYGHASDETLVIRTLELAHQAPLTGWSLHLPDYINNTGWIPSGDRLTRLEFTLDLAKAPARLKAEKFITGTLDFIHESGVSVGVPFALSVVKASKAPSQETQ